MLFIFDFLAENGTYLNNLELVTLLKGGLGLAKHRLMIFYGE